MPQITLKHDGTIAIATGQFRNTKVWKNSTVTLSEFYTELSETHRTAETVAEFKAFKKPQQDAVKDIGGFVGGSLTQGRRKAGSVESRSLITLDADFAGPDLLDTFDLMFGNSAACYSTHKHTRESPRLRLIVPVSRPMTAEEYPAVARMVAKDLGIDQFDDTTYQPARLMYWPSTSKDGEYYFKYLDGELLNPDTVLARYSHWQDTSFWPVSSRAISSRKRTAEKQGDPRTKPGLVGAFCRTYSVVAAIEKFIPEKYVACDAPNRYTYTGGSTAAGLVVYDNELFAYSNPATAPASERLCNAFDLVRIHLYGGLDDDAEPDTPINRLPSYTKMTELAQGDTEVKIQTGRERLQNAQEDFDGPEDDGRWMAKLTTNKKGDPESTIENVHIILTNDPRLKGAIGFNAFKERIVRIAETPWSKVQDTANGDTWSDYDDSALRRYLETGYTITGKGKIDDAVINAARENKMHPIQDYLSGLEWDGVERLDKLLVDYLSAEDTPYTRAVTRKTFTAAVARAMEPGCKFDQILVISGPQGRGKSSLIYKMSRGWFTDSLMKIGTKEAYEGLQGCWLVELGELAAMRKLEVEVTKNFISKQVDNYRVSYGHWNEDHPRQCVFFGTTNSTAFLRDDTGNRRFWPVRLKEEPPALKVWGDLTNDVIDQLWAEAVVRYKDKELLTLSAELAESAQEQQAEFTEDDPRAGLVQVFLDTLLPEDWSSKTEDGRAMWFAGEFGRKEGTQRRDRVCVTEVWCECFGKDRAALTRQNTNEIRSMMKQMPGWEENPKKQKCGPYGVAKVFDRVPDLEP